MRETRSPTADELRQLVHFVCWGGLPQVFDAWNKEWKTERERLESLLSESELESARASTLNAHFTAPVVIRAMFAGSQGFGSRGILESMRIEMKQRYRAWENRSVHQCGIPTP